MSRILIIDDDADYRAMLRAFIEERGHSVMEADSADAGMSLFLNDKADLVISDMRMPVKSGLDLLQELKRVNPKVLFIMITGFPDVDTAVRATREGAFDYLAKPTATADLAAVMNRALAQVELRSNLTTMRGLNIALLISIPLWIVLGIAIRMLFAD
jgi:DNA-binding NtrC family response regulator